MSTKIVKLTALNVEALNLIGPKVSALLETTKTTATFVGVTAYEALGIVGRMQDVAAAEYGTTGHPTASLNAVRRKLLTLAEAEQANEDRMRAESAKVEEMRDSGVLADGVAAAKARSEAQAEQDAANDPLIALLDNTTHAANISPIGARVHAALSDAQVAQVMATLAEQAAGNTVVFRALGWHSGPGRVADRLIPLSKSGQRRPKRSRRG